MDQARSELISQFIRAGVVDLYLLATLPWRPSEFDALQAAVRLQPDDGLRALRLRTLTAVRLGISPLGIYESSGLLGPLIDGLLELSNLSEAHALDAIAALRLLCQDDRRVWAEPHYALSLLFLLANRSDMTIRRQDLEEVNRLVNIVSASPHLHDNVDLLESFCEILIEFQSVLEGTSPIRAAAEIVDEILDDVPAGTEARPELLNFSIYAMEKLTGSAINESELRKIIARQEALIALAPEGLPLAYAYDHLHMRLTSLWKLTGEQDLVQRQKDSLVRAIEAHSDDEPDGRQYTRAHALISLAMGIPSLSKIEDIVYTDIDWALADWAARVAVRFCAPENIDQLAETVAILGATSLKRYKLTENDDSLAEAHRFLEEAVNLTEPRHPDRGQRLAILADCFIEQNNRSVGSVPARSTWVFESALQLFYTEPNEDRARALNDYAHVFSKIVAQSADINLLRRAYEMVDESVRLTSLESESRAFRLANLSAHALELSRYENDDTLAAQALQAAEEAVGLYERHGSTPGMALYNLAAVLFALSDRTEDPVIPQRAEALIEAALEQDLDPDDRAVLLLSVARMYNSSANADQPRSTRQYALLEEAVRIAPPGSPAAAEALSSFALEVLGRALRLQDAELFESGMTLVDRIVGIVSALGGPLKLYTQDGPGLVRLLTVMTFQDIENLVNVKEIWRRIAALGVALVDGLRYRGFIVGVDAWAQFHRSLELRSQYQGIGALAAWAHLQMADFFEGGEGEAVVRAFAVLESSLSVATGELAGSLSRDAVTDQAVRQVVERISGLQAMLASGTVPAPFDGVVRRAVDIGFRPEVPATPNQVSQMMADLRSAVNEAERMADPTVRSAVTLDELVSHVNETGRPLVWLAAVDPGRNLGPYRFELPGLCFVLRPNDSCEALTQPRLNCEALEQLQAVFVETAAAADPTSAGRAVLRSGELAQARSDPGLDFNSAMLRLPDLIGPEPADVFEVDADIVTVGPLHQLPLESVAPRARIGVSASRLIRPERRAPIDWQTRMLLVANPDLSLPGAQLEGKRLASRFSGRALLGHHGAPVSKVQFIEAMKEMPPAVLHLASHGLREQLITFGSVAQTEHEARTSLGDRHFGFSDFRHIEQSLRDTWLIFVNCCFSGSSRPGLEDDAVSFATAALSCGVGAAIAPRWPVDDFGAAAFGISFYQNLVKCDGELRTALARTQKTSDDPRTAYAYTLLI